MMTQEIMRCIECTDEMMVDPIGCDKCSNTLCGYCCEFEEEGK